VRPAAGQGGASATDTGSCVYAEENAWALQQQGKEADEGVVKQRRGRGPCSTRRAS
jgi:hypothetical protein